MQKIVFIANYKKFKPLLYLIKLAILQVDTPNLYRIMSQLTDYFIALAICSPIFFFIIAVTFRLMDNSAAIFLDHEIFVDSSYVSVEMINEQLTNTEDEALRKALKRVLMFRRLHNLFMILALITLPPVIIACFLNPF